jgi:hypothetical protein
MTDKVSPVRPDEVAKEKEKTFPDAVLESFNQLIIQKFSGGRATISQDDIVALMVEKGLDRTEIFKRGWLDVERVYQAAGWEVEYDKPGFNESYPATFTFKRPSKRD